MFVKKLLLIVGLMAVVASVTQQEFGFDTGHSFGGSQASVLQLDKDNPRDAGDKAVIAALTYNHPPEKSPVYYYFSASYQEPTLLVQQRPPNT